MKFSLEPLTNVNHIHTYDDNYVVVKVKDTSELLKFTNNLIITPQYLITDQSINALNELTVSDVDYLKSLEPEVVVLAHKSSVHISPQILVLFSKQGIGVESMSLGAACRTYNLLVSEDRHVVLVVQL